MMITELLNVGKLISYSTNTIHLKRINQSRNTDEANLDEVTCNRSDKYSQNI